MKIVSKRRFPVAAGVVWSILQDPTRMTEWNPKCVGCRMLQTADSSQKFAVTYEMNGKRSEALGMVVSSEENRSIHFRYLYEDAAKVGMVEERFELEALGPEDLQVTHSVDFSQSTLPRWLKWLMVIFSRFGKSMGGGPMDGLSSMILSGAVEANWRGS